MTEKSSVVEKILKKTRELVKAAESECSCWHDTMGPCPRHNYFAEGAGGIEARLAGLAPLFAALDKS